MERNFHFSIHSFIIHRRLDLRVVAFLPIFRKIHILFFFSPFFFVHFNFQVFFLWWQTATWQIWNKPRCPHGTTTKLTFVAQKPATAIKIEKKFNWIGCFALEMFYCNNIFVIYRITTTMLIGNNMAKKEICFTCVCSVVADSVVAFATFHLVSERAEMSRNHCVNSSDDIKSHRMLYSTQMNFCNCKPIVSKPIYLEKQFQTYFGQCGKNGIDSLLW